MGSPIKNSLVRYNKAVSVDFTAGGNANSYAMGKFSPCSFAHVTAMS
jgi:hypothetical protein